MTLRNKLILLFSFLAILTLSSFALILYWNSAKNREIEFFEVLEKEAKTKADLYFIEKVNPNTLSAIYKSNRATIHEVEVAIYTPPFTLIYHDAVEIDVVKETPEMLEQALKNGIYHFYQEDWQVIAMPYIHEEETYIITAAAYDGSGYAHLQNQKRTSLWLIFGFSGFVFIIASIFAVYSLRPLKKMTETIDKIQVDDLNKRIPLKKYEDEIAKLARIFNNLLNRLQNSFQAQKEVVAHISHEFRTPLTALLMEIEIAEEQFKEEAIQEVLSSIKSDALKMKTLFESLMDLAKSQYDQSQITFSRFRIDDLLIVCKEKTEKLYSNAHIRLHYKKLPENVDTYSYKGNPHLMQQAFMNLLENAYKYSKDKTCTISIDKDANHTIIISFEDNGIGIAANEQEKIFQAFYQNKDNAKGKGYGIGLALSQQIIHLHKGTIQVASTLGKGTVFTLNLPEF